MFVVQNPLIQTFEKMTKYKQNKRVKVKPKIDQKLERKLRIWNKNKIISKESNVFMSARSYSKSRKRINTIWKIKWKLEQLKPRTLYSGTITTTTTCARSKFKRILYICAMNFEWMRCSICGTEFGFVYVNAISHTNKTTLNHLKHSKSI